MFATWQNFIGSQSVLVQNVLYGLIVVLGLMVLFYLFKRDQDFKTKFLGLISLLIGLAAFFAFFAGGWMVGKATGIGAIGALMGVLIFGFIFGGIARYRVRNNPNNRINF